MKTDWGIFEKIMSIIQMILGIVIIWIVIKTIKSNLNELHGSLNFYWDNLLEINVLKKIYFSTFHGLIGVIGALLWFKDKTTGWLLSLSFWILTCCSVTLTTSRFKFQEKQFNIYRASQEYWIYSVVIFISLILILVLSSKYFREKYSPDARILAVYGSILAVLLIDRFIYFISI